MNQLYTEVGVKKINNSKTIMIRSLMIMGVIVGFFIMLLPGLMKVIGMAFMFLFIFMLTKLNVEYEYVFVDGQIDFDRIVGKSKRKTLLRIDMDQIEIVAPFGSHALDSYSNMQFENRDYTSGDKAIKPYIIIASIESKRYRIAFEPTEKMLSMMKQKSPRKISQF